ncbi:MAG: sulfite exporter TauE/SafE family protein, partial [Clostridia bacterium]|nr:sulfite exporter TauE/SafE family protein [Clostridia bacterium]
MALITKRIRISGMSCINCQKRITAKLRGTPGIREASVSYRDGTARIAFDSAVITYEQIAKIIDHLGYKALPDGKTGFGRAALLSALVLVLYVLLEKTGILNLLIPGKLAESGMGYGMLFVVGLLTSVHCIAMCGGINLSQCLPGSVRQKNALLPSLCYNAGRVISYTVIGLLLGLIGLLSCEAQVEGRTSRTPVLQGRIQRKRLVICTHMPENSPVTYVAGE